MRRFLLSAFITLSFFSSKAAIYNWSGLGFDGGLWSNPLNWLQLAVPGATDDVILDNLWGNPLSYTVTLPGGAVTTSVNTITITPILGNNITLILPSSNTAIPGLEITGVGDALILNNGAILKNSSGGLPGVAISIADIFRINNGGHYIHNTDSGNFSIVNRLSTAVGTELGEFEYDVPTSGYGISVSGRNYGTLTINAIENAGPTTYTGSGATDCNVKGNLNVNTNVTFNLSMSANFIVTGNYNQAASSTFDLQSSTFNDTVKIAGNLSIGGTITESGSGSPTLELNGASNQDITVTGSVINTIDFKLDNSAGATLLSGLTLPYRYSIDTGNLTLGSNDLITPAIIQISPATLTSNHIVTNSTGVLTIQNITAGPIAFPVGPTTDSLNTLSISNGSGNNYSVRVEKGINPVANSFPTYGINRTWDIQASAPNAGVIVAFQYATADANPGALPQPQAMEILLYSGSAWSIIPGNTGINPTGANPAWVVTTATGLAIPTASPAPYALGKEGGWILPIDCIISTRAQKINNTGVISWTVSSCSEVRNFEVQRSVNGSGFQTIGTVNPVANQIDFNFTDASLAGGRNLYRIKVNGIVSSSKYSNTVVLIHNSNDILISSLVPNPVHDKALLTVSAGRNATIDFKIYNAMGNLVKQWSSVVAEGNNTIEVNATGLAAGMYTVFAYSKGSTTVSRFVKQ